MATAESVDRAIAIATQAHRGQTDKSGEPYIGHPERVADRLAEDDHDGRVVAWLHDVVEDTDVTADDLAADFDAAIVAAVVALTRVEKDEPDDYYRRVRADPLALRVKFADIADNTDPARVARLDDRTRTRLAGKYDHALEVLRGG
ncbi:HD domain-containing protein [Microlunatus soli]|nr:HD domain-containing protein [Microlunatus soli]